MTAVLLGLTAAITRAISKRHLEDYEKLKKAVDTSGEIIFITDREGIFTYVNPEFTRVYGFQPQHILGKQTPRILKSGVMEEENYHKFWEHILQKNVVEGEIVNQTKSGRLIDVQSSANPILNGKGDITGFLCIQRDITERKTRERELIASEKTARAMLNASEDPVYLIDAKGALLSLNEAAVHALGDSLDALTHKSIYDFEFFRLTDQYQKIKTAIQEKRKIRYQEKSGDTFYDITIYPIFDLKGGVSRLAIFNADISSQKAAEETIREQNRFLQSVIEALDHPFFVIDVHDYTVKLANSAARGIREMGRIPCYALTHNLSEPCKSETHVCPLNTMLKTHEPMITEHIHYDKEGRKREVEVHAYPIFDKDGKLIQMIEYTLDITDRKQAFQEIENLHEQLNRHNRD
ncbi:MAG: PAS domain S-box protein [candidate division KSB1 bacterium]|nr:PAS domain S-box protein [candidate division KSB1 bacterium]